MSRDAPSAINRKNSQAADESTVSTSNVAGKDARRVFVAGLLIAVLGLVSVLVVLRVFVAQRIPELTEASLTEAEDRWDRAAVASYEMDIKIGGAQPGQVHIEVRNDEVIAMTRDNRFPPQRTWDVWSVPGMFETLERELELAQDPVHEMQAAVGTQLRLRCEFDPQLGYPRRYHRYITPGGPEVFWQVTRFQSK
jgi:hypothetical protein